MNPKRWSLEELHPQISSPTSPLKQAEPVGDAISRSIQQVPWLWMPSGPTLSQSCGTDTGAANKFASVALLEGTNFPFLFKLLLELAN